MKKSAKYILAFAGLSAALNAGYMLRRHHGYNAHQEQPITDPARDQLLYHVVNRKNTSF
jgi:hypothetical protein